MNKAKTTLKTNKKQSLTLKDQKDTNLGKYFRSRPHSDENKWFQNVPNY